MCRMCGSARNIQRTTHDHRPHHALPSQRAQTPAVEKTKESWQAKTHRHTCTSMSLDSRTNKTLAPLPAPSLPSGGFFVPRDAYSWRGRVGVASQCPAVSRYPASPMYLCGGGAFVLAGGTVGDPREHTACCIDFQALSVTPQQVLISTPNDHHVLGSVNRRSCCAVTEL